MSILNQAISVPCHPKNRGGSRPASAIKYLVIHYTGNDGDKAANNAKYYQNSVVQASAHYFVDDAAVYQSVEDLGIAWAVGGKKWSDCPRTGGGSLYGVVTNANSLSIELCDTSRDGRLMATEATLDRAAELGRALMAKYNIPIERVVRHFDVTGKHCPAYFMDKAAWAAFKKRLEPSSPPVAPWYAEARSWAKDKGITDGTRPEETCTRAEVWEMLKRYEKADSGSREES